MKRKIQWLTASGLTLILAFFLVSAGKTTTEKPANVVQVNSANFKEVAARKGYVIMDFWATWCAPCRKLGPELESLAKEMGPEKITIGKINVDKNRDLARSFSVRSIPMMMIYKDGKAKQRLVGYYNKEQIKQILKKLK